MKVANKETIREVLDLLNVKALKKYGQNFLSNEEIAEKIVSLLALKETDYVVEIGPGIGALTHYLSESGAKIKAVEIDRAIAAFLADSYKDQPNVEIINQNFLKYKFDNKKHIKVIGNLPYYITTPILEKIIKNSASIDQFVVMVQNEVTKRFNAKVNEEEYAPLSIMLYLLGKGENAFKVGNQNFFPQPKVASQVYVYNFNHSYSNEYIDELYRLVTAIFTNRRKNILNNLTIILGNKEKAQFIIKQLNIQPTLRPENIEPQIYVNILNEIIRKKWLETVTYPRGFKRG